MRVIEDKKELRLVFSYHPAVVEAVKDLPDRSWNQKLKCWTVPLKHKETVQQFAIRNGFKWGIGGAEFTVEDYENKPYPEMPELTIDIPLKLEMYGYQKQGVAYSIDKKRLIIGDKPGLGKTVQAIATVHATGMFPCLVISPSSLKKNWQDEWHMWTDRKAIILNDRVKRTWDQFWHVGLAQVFIVNFESLRKYMVTKMDDPGKDNDGKKLPLRLHHIHFSPMIGLFKSVIIDESHKVKDIAAQQTKFCKGITNGKEMVLLATGTPVINKPKDLMTQLAMIGRLQEFGGSKGFTARYCSGPNKASNLRELGHRLRETCFYQRDKKDVLKDLPDKTRQIVHVEISNRPEYDAAEADFIKYLIQFKKANDEKVERAMRGQIMVKIGILRNVAARGKIQAVQDYVKDLQEDGEKLILFGHLKEVIDSMRKAFPKAVSITGDDSLDQKERAKTEFQKCKRCGIKLDKHAAATHDWEPSDTNLILCSIKAAGVGHTLTASSRVGFIEFPWTAADCDQCEDRAHRIGQKNNVQCLYFLGLDTIDEKIYEIIQAKRSIAAAITGTTEQIEESIIDDIINLFSQKQ